MSINTEMLINDVNIEEKTPTEILFNISSNNDSTSRQEFVPLNVKLQVSQGPLTEVKSDQNNEKSKCIRYQTRSFQLPTTQGFGDIRHDQSLRSVNSLQHKSLKMRQNKIKNSIRQQLASSPYSSHSNKKVTKSSNVDELVFNFSNTMSSDQRLKK